MNEERTIRITESEFTTLIEDALPLLHYVGSVIETERERTEKEDAD